MDVTSPVEGTVVAVAVAPGDHVPPGGRLCTIEIMKMEQEVTSPAAATVTTVEVVVGDTVARGAVVARLEPADDRAAQATAAPAQEPATERADLAELRRRKALLDDAARPEAVARRRERGHRTARENVADLVDVDSFVEYGAFAIAAQRQRRDVEDLVERTPADGLVTGLATVNAGLVGEDRARCAVMAYDYTVLAGTQGMTNHDKLDRLLDLARRHRLPLVSFVEGGGGRPGDTDHLGASWLDVTSFRAMAQLSGRVPLVSIVNGYCFAGNAALAGMADVVIATASSNLGMAGPAMIEGGGLGKVDPTDIGPADLHARTGAADLVVADEAEAVDVARRVLSMFQGAVAPGPAADQAVLRDAVPEKRTTIYEVRPILDTMFDEGSVLELRRDAAPGMVTALARLEGRAVGVLANDPSHLGGAIDGDAADSASRLLSLCDAHGLPVVVLCDTPGFMVGPEAEQDAGVRRFARLFLAGANLRVPLVAVVLRKAYGLGAQAMLGGDLRAPVATFSWPTGELGPMGLEGAVRLGFRKELDAAGSDQERADLEQQLIGWAHLNAAALNVATHAEIDDVIDPADTRACLAAVLATATADGDLDPPHRFVDPW